MATALAVWDHVQTLSAGCATVKVTTQGRETSAEADCGLFMSTHSQEVASGERFEFGRNWQQFLRALTPQRIAQAEDSLRTMLGVLDLEGSSFLDAGCGSGLASLAARQLGARVHSFDYDPQSVACTQELKRRYAPDDPLWTIEAGSVLDVGYLESLGKFDLVYSWGVLHHTGAMWPAMENIIVPLTAGGRLFLAIYNHQRYWTWWHTCVKRSYVSAPRPLKWLIVGAYTSFEVTKGLVKDLVLLRNPLARYRQETRPRGMSWWHDTLDWIGGYPFETATASQVFDFYQPRGFVLERLDVSSGHGCSQFVFRKALEHWVWTNQPYSLAIVPQPSAPRPSID